MNKREASYPYMAINGEFFSKEFLDNLWIHLHKMAPLWEAGICEPTAADKFSYVILKQVTFRMPNVEILND